MCKTCNTYPIPPHIPQSSVRIPLHSERERIEKEVKTKTVSLWSLILSNKADFENPLYNPATRHHVLFPRTSMRHLCLWDKYYCRWNPSMRQQVRRRGNGRGVRIETKIKRVHVYVCISSWCESAGEGRRGERQRSAQPELR